MEVGQHGLFHVASSEGFRRDDLARLFLRTVGSDMPVLSREPEYFGFSEPRPLNSCLDSSRLVRATGVRFSPVREIVAGFWDAQKRNDAMDLRPTA